MSRLRFGSALLAVLGFSSLAPSALADAPRIDAIAPLGMQRGVTTEVTISGANFAGTAELLAPFGIKFATPPAPNKDAAKWTFKATVDPATPIGVYLIRVRTEEGLSNPFLLSVGQLPQVGEKEDNSTFETAQVVPLGSVVEGQAAGNDVDYFRFSGKKGQRILVDAQCARIGSGVDPSIRLTTVAHKFVSSADDTPGLLTDARLTATLPEDTDYVIELSDSRYQGGGRPVYRLTVGAVPTAEEIYPLGGRRGESVAFELRGGTLPDERIGAVKALALPGLDTFQARFTDRMLGLEPTGPTPIDVESLPNLAVEDFPEVREPTDPKAPPLRLVPPVVINGRIETKGDQDRFTIVVTPGQKIHFEVTAADLGSALDGILEVRNPANAVLATADDATAPGQGRNNNRRALAVVSPDPSLDFTVPAGVTEISLGLRDLKGDGGLGYPYRITVEPTSTSFDVALGDAQINVPKNGTVALPVSITRRGFTGPVTVTVKDPPKGMTVRPGTIPTGQTAGVLTVSCAPDAAFGLVTLDVIGQGQGPTGPITESARKGIIFAQQTTLPTNVVTQLGLPATPTPPVSIKIDAPEAPVELVHGYGASVPLKVTRAKDATDAVLTVTPLVSPAGQPLPALGVPLILSPGLTVPNATIAAKAADGALVVNAAPEAPLGVATLVVNAAGKIANKDQVFAAPLIRVDVVRPATIEFPAAIEVKAGSTFELKGKLVRKGPFKEPVTIKLDALPAGLKAEPATVAPDKSEFVVKIVADPKAAVAAGAAKVTPAFQINKKDYATPPSPLAVKVLAAK